MYCNNKKKIKGKARQTFQGFWFYHFHKQPQAKVEVTREKEDLKLGDTLRLIWTDQVANTVSLEESKFYTRVTFLSSCRV